jgi:UDP-3-O-[3-hydroxymyristoyl] glucosamine N-acyltransferase
LFTVVQISKWIEAQHANPGSPAAVALFSSLNVTGIATLKDAGPNDVAFFFSRNYEEELKTTKAGLIITGLPFVAPLEASGLPQWKSSVFIATADPYSAMAKVSSEFSKHISTHDHQREFPETIIHPAAIVDPSAKIGTGVQIGANVVIEAGCVIADHVVIYAGSYLGPNCEVGESTVLFPRVTLYEKTKIGRHCRIHAGVVLGADGFGYAPLFDSHTKLPIAHQKIYHLGRVVMGDHVEIGANSTIDRGTLGNTVVHSHAKIDNLVQVGHNCEVGEGSIMCGASGLAGSSSLGKFVYVGAQAGTGNQVHVGDYAKLAGYAGAAKDVAPNAEVAGVPARPLADYFKILAIQNKLLRERSKKN